MTGPSPRRVCAASCAKDSGLFVARNTASEAYHFLTLFDTPLLGTPLLAVHTLIRHTYGVTAAFRRAR